MLSAVSLFNSISTARTAPRRIAGVPMARGPKLFPYLNDPRVIQWLRQATDQARAETLAQGKSVWYAVPGLRGLVREDPDGRRWHVVRRKVVAKLPPRESSEPPPEESS